MTRAGRRTLAVEAAVSLAVAALFTWSCVHIRIDPLQRIGQISGLASLGLRFTIAALVLIAVLLVARHRWRAHPERFERVTGLACAALAGLASAMIAGGVIVALTGTKWGLNGAAGDAGDWIRWARGYQMYASYPPLSIELLDRYADLLGIHHEYALKHLQIAGTAVLGPAIYASWRLLLPPMWALGVGTCAALPLLEVAPYKPYTHLVLIVFVPLIVRVLDRVRAADAHGQVELARAGVVYGAAFGVLCLLYSGWFQWTAPGVLVALLVVFPYRRAPRNALLFLGSALAAFLAIAGSYLARAVAGGTFPDRYVYFDVFTEPAYVAMFRGDLPGQIPMWPPFGELGGVGVYTILLLAGLALALALGRGRTLVIALGSIVAGAWLLRFWYAHQLYDTKLVQLYPRTTAVILHGLLVLAGYAVYLAMERHRDREPASALHGPSAAVGAFCALALLFGSAGSAIANAHMPVDTWPFATGRLAWTAHHPDQFRWGQQPRLSWWRQRKN